ncbi:MAG: hypothetical protein A7316_09345 [Candidatus Altiarchaeales archaeon WOR_SM1_86-2]|nr:MAG: hypothetical protein A7316_09345 [Candidatus Altiarchaeales archaeon WOR_SM1_86-2]
MDRIPPIKDIKVEFTEDGLTKHGLFGLLAWYLVEILDFEKRCEIVTVKRKRNRDKNKSIKRRKCKFPEPKMCIGIVATILLGIKRFEKIDDKLHDEVRIANMIGLEKFFDKTTARKFINEFQLWHLRQLDQINTDLLRDFGESFRQDFAVLDIDATTHSVESKKREGAVPGYNKKNRGKPCYQWSIGFIRDEIVSQVLSKGNTHCSQRFKYIVEDVGKKLGTCNLIIRLDEGYMSADTLNYSVENGLQIVITCRMDWILAQKENKIDHSRWFDHNETTRLLDAGLVKVVSECPHKFRVIFVEQQQEKIKVVDDRVRKTKKPKKYAIVSRLNAEMDAGTLYEFHHQRQTIENFFKESKNPFNSSKMPSQKFRGNEAYLHLVMLAYNCFTVFKKDICQQSGRYTVLKKLKIR